MGSIANILLQVTGDSSEARKELADVARDLALFAREEAEAEAYVDTTEGKLELDELKAKLAAFDGKDVSAEVNLKIAKAQADLAVLEAELKKVDGEDVTVDVDVKRGIVEKLGSLSKQVADLGDDLEGVSGGGLSSFVSGIGEAFSGTSIFGVSLKAVAIAAPFLITALVAVVGQLAAVVATALSAAGGLGALAVAFVSTLVPGILLAVGAVARFKEQSEIAGTAAHALREGAGKLFETFKNATAGGADALFRGLADGVKEITPLIDHLGPAFTRLGQAGGDAIRLLADHFSSPAWEKFFTFATDSLTRLTPLFARSFGAFADILKNIATAAMPFLIDAFRSLAEGIEGVADKTSDIGGLRDVIGGMVHSLSAVGDLLGGLTDLTAAFVEAFAPFGDSIVESLAEGAHNLADWLRSSDGLDEVKQFFETTGPLASELAKLVLNVGLGFIQLAEVMAPPMTAVVNLLNSLFEAANKGLDYITDHAPDVGRVLAAVVSPITLLAAAFGPIKDAAKTAFEAVKGVAEDAIAAVSQPIDFVLRAPREVLGVIRDIWQTAKGIVSDVIEFVLKAPRDVLGVVRDIWRSAKGVVNDVIDFVLKAPRDVLGAVRDIWRTAKDVISDAIDFVLKVPRDAAGAARDLWGQVKGIITNGIDFVIGFASGIIDKARSIWDAVNSALPDITLNIDIPTPKVPHIDVPGLATGVRDLLSGGLHRVGEEGEELMYVPTGADMFTANETRRILRALAGGASMPAAAPNLAGTASAGAGGGGGVTIGELNVVSPGTGSPDPDVALAKISAKLRARGGF